MNERYVSLNVVVGTLNDEFSEETIRQKVREYNIHLDQNPNDIDAWLEFISFQDKSLRFGKTKRSESATAKSSINEVKISIFEKALEINPHNSRLLGTYLKCCEKNWDVPKLLTKWDQVLKDNSTNISLWIQYLDFRQTNLVSFTVSQCLQVFEDCLHVLRKAVLVTLDRSEKLEIETIMIHIFQRACFFMFQSGYTERAYACWQAMIELTFFGPDSQNPIFYDRIANLENFWESEKPRFGEINAEGWGSYNYQHSEIDDIENFNTLPTSLNLQNIEGDTFEKWIKAENFYENELLPIRSKIIDESDLDDPYRIVIFDDICSFLFDLTSNESRLELLYACFDFVGTSFNPSYSSSNPLIIDSFLNSKLANELISENKSNNLFKSENWPSICDDIESYNINMNFARNAISQISQCINDPGIKLCQLALEQLYDVSSAKNLARNMLEKESTNLSFWNGYALLEKSMNNITDAQKVYLATLSQYRKFPEEYKQDVPLIYRMFAEMEIEQHHLKTALNSISEMDVPSIKILKARKYFSQQLASLTSSSASKIDLYNFLNYSICLAFLEYTSRGLQHACKVFDETLENIEHSLICDTSEREETFKILQDLLIRALDAFPNNTIFLSLFLHEETNGNIPTSLNQMLENMLKKNPNHILWTFAIFSELHSQHPYDVHRVRNLFDKALECPNKAKILYYNAIRECPWSKDLYMIAFRKLRSQFSTEELDEVMNVMLEKEIRLRVSMEKFTEEKEQEETMTNIVQ
ncbi:11722_t:CDS:10 [Entrophospora sp. SA101]|nr:11722_t:CDS:10 [Entrophospora sp. SA101]